MRRCLCCNKELSGKNEYELKTGWHVRCIRRFFGTSSLPALDCSEKALEEGTFSFLRWGSSAEGGDEVEHQNIPDFC